MGRLASRAAADLMPTVTLPSFEETLQAHKIELNRTPLQTVQVNIGLLCNLACRHCHVESAPSKTKENMDERTIDRLIELLEKSPGVKTLDLTGGAPEMNPYFKKLVSAAKKMKKHVIDRCNLTVLKMTGQEETAVFLAENQVEIIASLPCYSRDRVDFQRGKGVYDGSIGVLRMLNTLGYGKASSGLALNLVFNPTGAYLPGDQQQLEKDYKAELGKLFDIEFNRLYTITNMAIKRFASDLKRKDKLEVYQEKLVTAFNPAATQGLMCRSLVNVNWQGNLYDCDFNHALELPLAGPKTLWNLDSFDEIKQDPIALADHCFGCTAGAGSSCGGSLL